MWGGVGGHPLGQARSPTRTWVEVFVLGDAARCPLQRMQRHHTDPGAFRSIVAFLTRASCGSLLQPSGDPEVAPPKTTVHESCRASWAELGGLRAAHPIPHTHVPVPTQVTFSCPAPAYGSACCWIRRSSPSSSSSSSSASCPEERRAELLPGRERPPRAPQSPAPTEPLTPHRSARDGPGLRHHAPRCFASRLLKTKSMRNLQLHTNSCQNLHFNTTFCRTRPRGAFLRGRRGGGTLREARRSPGPHPAGPQGGAVGRAERAGVAFPTRSGFRCAPRRGGAGGLTRSVLRAAQRQDGGPGGGAEGVRCRDGC